MGRYLWRTHRGFGAASTTQLAKPGLGSTHSGARSEHSSAGTVPDAAVTRKPFTQLMACVASTHNRPVPTDAHFSSGSGEATQNAWRGKFLLSTSKTRHTSAKGHVVLAFQYPPVPKSLVPAHRSIVFPTHRTMSSCSFSHPTSHVPTRTAMQPAVSSCL